MNFQAFCARQIIILISPWVKSKSHSCLQIFLFSFGVLWTVFLRQIQLFLVSFSAKNSIVLAAMERSVKVKTRNMKKINFITPLPCWFYFKRLNDIRTNKWIIFVVSNKKQEIFLGHKVFSSEPSHIKKNTHYKVS